jgi:hypothetical protein
MRNTRDEKQLGFVHNRKLCSTAFKPFGQKLFPTIILDQGHHFFVPGSGFRLYPK